MIVEQKKIKYLWGKETVWADTDSYRGSFMSIKHGQTVYDNSKVSRKETVYVLYGTLIIELNDGQHEVKKGQSFHLDTGIERILRAPYDDVDIVVISN
jgi:quercetin dioxygenase-like cupin family protein